MPITKWNTIPRVKIVELLNEMENMDCIAINSKKDVAEHLSITGMTLGKAIDKYQIKHKYV